VALYYTSLVTFPVVALGVALGVESLPVTVTDQVDQLTHARMGLALVVLVLVLASVALLRYLLLSLFTPRAAALPASPASHASS